MKKLETKEDFAHWIASLAQRAVLYEVSTTPKPGLVDCRNSGAHRDMDIFTFMASSSVLYKGFYECTIGGLNFDETDDTKLLEIIRSPGIECEKDMFEATNGVNTHKGIIFSIGIICAVAGKLYRENQTLDFKIEDICNGVKNVTAGLSCKEFYNIQTKTFYTNGEKIYLKYGFKGIRGEVESGFETVRKKAVRLLREWKNTKSLSMNELFLEILINLMTENEDTNVVIRGGIESIMYIKSISGEFLQSGGMNQKNAVEKLWLMDEELIRKNISPGGSADLLAVSIFLGMLEGIIK